MPLDGLEDPVAAMVALTAILVAVSAIPVVFNFIGRWIWDDWLDDRLGRGSIKDEFPRRHW